MLAIALALGASLSWGLGDFLGGLKSRSAARPDGARGLPGLRPGGGADLGRGVGRRCSRLVRDSVGCSRRSERLPRHRDALSRDGDRRDGNRRSDLRGLGRDSVRGRRRVRRATGALQIAGILIALAGVAVASREPREQGGGRAAGFGLALLAALGFGLYFVFADRAADESVPYAVATARGVSLLLALAAALIVGVSLRPGRGSLPVLAVVGLCDVGANMLFSLATTRGYLSIVSVLAALYPVVTVALAAIVLHERVARTQRFGVAGALVGAAMITAG